MSKLYEVNSISVDARPWFPSPLLTLRGVCANSNTRLRWPPTIPTANLWRSFVVCFLALKASTESHPMMRNLQRSLPNGIECRYSQPTTINCGRWSRSFVLRLLLTWKPWRQLLAVCKCVIGATGGVLCQTTRRAHHLACMARRIYARIGEFSNRIKISSCGRRKI